MTEAQFLRAELVHARVEIAKMRDSFDHNHRQRIAAKAISNIDRALERSNTPDTPNTDGIWRARPRITGLTPTKPLKTQQIRK